jgi:hypothetical protein
LTLGGRIRFRAVSASVPARERSSGATAAGGPAGRSARSGRVAALIQGLAAAIAVRAPTGGCAERHQRVLRQGQLAQYCEAPAEVILQWPSSIAARSASACAASHLQPRDVERAARCA